MTSPFKYWFACHYNAVPGWWCSQERDHEGPCSLRPYWWNLSEFARRYRRTMESRSQIRRAWKQFH